MLFHHLIKSVSLVALVMLGLTSAWAPRTVISSRSKIVQLRMSGDVETGTVKWFDSTKGFGFLVPDNGGPDVFVHQTAIQAAGFRSLAEGEAVEFKIETDENGRARATDVTGPDGANVKGAARPPRQNFDDDYY